MEQWMSNKPRKPRTQRFACRTLPQSQARRGSRRWKRPACNLRRLQRGFARRSFFPLEECVVWFPDLLLLVVVAVVILFVMLV